MKKLPGYNRNLMNGKRYHKGIQKYGQYTTLVKRLIAEVKALKEYKDRVKNQKVCKNG